MFFYGCLWNIITSVITCEPLVVCFEDLRRLPIFQLYRDFEPVPEMIAARRGTEPRSRRSAIQDLFHYTTTAPRTR